MGGGSTKRREQQEKFRPSESLGGRVSSCMMHVSAKSAVRSDQGSDFQYRCVAASWSLADVAISAQHQRH
jgi:hypothetical protein